MEGKYCRQNMFTIRGNVYFGDNVTLLLVLRHWLTNLSENCLALSNFSEFCPDFDDEGVVDQFFLSIVTTKSMRCNSCIVLDWFSKEDKSLHIFERIVQSTVPHQIDLSTFDCPPLPLWKYDLHKCKCPSESLRDPSYFKNTLSAPALMCRFSRISVKSSESRCKSHFIRLYLHSFPLSVTKGANLRKEWIVKFILDAVFFYFFTMILWTLDSRVLWDVRRGFGARPSSFRKPYLAFSSHIKFSWWWWWWSIDLYSNTCNCTIASWIFRYGLYQ